LKFLKSLVELCKVRITSGVALTVIAGYLLVKGASDTGLIMPVTGIFILACGSSAINQYQERDRDARMNRTKGRPIPSGRISPRNGLLAGLLLSIAGALILFTGSGLGAVLLGLLALFWYNGIYTPLKHRTAFAVVPGAVIGAIPPLIGWVAAGGEISDPRALIMAFFFFIWQVPHFWLLMVKYGKEYSAAGLPSITTIYSIRQIKKITFIWIFATVVSAVMLPVFGIVQSWIIIAGLFVAGFSLIGLFMRMFIQKDDQFKPMRYFIWINGFVLLMVIFISIDQFL
jgi:protoheme IX farnesyltransferase